MHDAVAAPLKFDTSDEDATPKLKIRGVDAEVYIEGMHGRIDALYDHQAATIKTVTGRLDSHAAALADIAATSKRIEAGIEKLAEAMGQMRGWIRDIEQREQPRQVRGKRK